MDPVSGNTRVTLPAAANPGASGDPADEDPAAVEPVEGSPDEASAEDPVEGSPDVASEDSVDEDPDSAETFSNSGNIASFSTIAMLGIGILGSFELF